MKTKMTLLVLLISLGTYSQEYPHSSPNGGRIGGRAWTAQDYINNAKEDSLNAVKNYKYDLAQAEYLKPEEKTKENKEKGWLAKNIVDTKENQRTKNEKLKEQQEKYEQKILEVNDIFNNKIKDIQKYRNDWVVYLKAEAIAKEKVRKEREIAAEMKQIQDEKDAKIAQEKAEQEREKRIAEYKAMPNNPEYKQWKTNYEKSIALAQGNVDKCEAIIKKHTYRNAFGEKLYDSSDFTSSEKKVFNQNLDLLAKNNKEIRNLENEDKFYYYWNETVSIEKSTSSYRLSNYYNSKNKAY